MWLVGIGALCNVKSDCLCVEQCFPVTLCVDFAKLIETDSLAPTLCQLMNTSVCLQVQMSHQAETEEENDPSGNPLHEQHGSETAVQR